MCFDYIYHSNTYDIVELDAAGVYTCFLFIDMKEPYDACIWGEKLIIAIISNS